MNKELTVISAVLADRDMVAFTTAKPEMFDAYSDVHEFLINYYTKNRDLPPAKIIEDKFSVVLLDEVGSTKHHVDELRDLYLKRQTRNILRAASQQLQDGELAGAIQSMVLGTMDLKRDSTDIRDVDAVDIEDAMDHFDRIRTLNENGAYGVTFDIPGIDDFLPSGVVPGMLGLILGYPARGKSFLTTLMAVNAWNLGKRVLYVSLEMTESEVRARIYAIAGEGKWSLRNLQRGRVDADEFKAWAEDRFAGRQPLPVVSGDGYERMSPSTLRAKIEEYNPDIVFIDYLQLMSPDGGKDGNATVRLMNLSTELKLLARASNTAIIGVVSATPADATDMTSIPELGQVAWSKQLAYDADFLLAVGRADNSPILGVAWRKNRNGPLSDWLLDCDFDAGIFKYSEMDFEDASM